MQRERSGPTPYPDPALMRLVACVAPPQSEVTNPSEPISCLKIFLSVSGLPQEYARLILL